MTYINHKICIIDSFSLGECLEIVNSIVEQLNHDIGEVKDEVKNECGHCTTFKEVLKGCCSALGQVYLSRHCEFETHSHYDIEYSLSI